MHHRNYVTTRKSADIFRYVISRNSAIIIAELVSKLG